MQLTCLSFSSSRLLIGVALVVAALTSGCSSGPAVLKANLAAGARINPDSHRRPSPVVVRVYELKSSTNFEQADFVSLFDNETATLGTELVNREEMVLRPGESKPLNKTLSADTKFIGVVGAFRELERAGWRAVVPVAAGKKNAVSISLDDISVQAKRTAP